jgi:hypothetical protein
MQALNDIQLELEIIAKDIETTQITFSESVKVSQSIRGMEKCLKKMVSEYEKQAGNFKGEPPTMEISSLPTLRDVVSPTEQSKIYSEFIKCYIEATQSIREDILMPQVALSSRSEQLNTPPNNSFNRSAG